MSIPLWVLLAFALWTIVTLLGTVGVYRWSRILTGRAQIAGFPADRPEGKDWYRRAMRAHANCVENLPVYTAIVVVMLATGAASPLLDGLAIVLMSARVCQTLVHVAFQETNAATAWRFAFFFIQILCMILMSIVIVRDVL
jgi:uncharacterized MAPEG superfamily protein